MDFDVATGSALLARTPGVLRAWLLDLPPAWLGAREGPETWSPLEIVGHLIDGELYDWIPRTRIVLEHGETRAFEPFDRFHHLTAYAGWPVGRRLDHFADLRERNLATLRELALTSEDLARTGHHPEFGPVTLAQHLSTWVVHDLDHMTQIARVLARAYGDAVGPWRAYLRVARQP